MTDATVLHDISPTNAAALASKEGFALDPRSLEDNINLVPSNHDDSSLPPIDGGKEAWLFLAACFVVEALVWGEALDGHFLPSDSTHTTKAFPSPTVSSRSTIPAMIRSKGPVILLL